MPQEFELRLSKQGYEICALLIYTFKILTSSKIWICDNGFSDGSVRGMHEASTSDNAAGAEDLWDVD